MKMYSDNAKTYVQLSSAALGLTITFVREIVGIPAHGRMSSAWLIIVWLCFLAAIGAGAFYQYLAAKYMESCIDWEHDTTWERLEPGTMYGVMLATFYAGAAVFTLYASIMLSR